MDRKLDIGRNIKILREKQNMTQKQLADQIGYTEKSVSKWEHNDGVPNVDVLVKISNLFRVSLDELVFRQISKQFLLGIDGGGTKTVFKLTDASGRNVRTVLKNSSNPNDIGIENAKMILDQGIREVCQGIPFQNVSMFAGLSGGGLTGNYRQILNSFFSDYGFLTFENGSDVENLTALAQYPRCILVIMGTGFITFCLNGEKYQRIGGWGYHFEEGGSGYSIGRDGIRAVLCASDGSGPQTCLSELLENRIGESAEEHLAEFYKGGKQYIAGFSDLVFMAAAENDYASNNILENHMRYVAHVIDTAYVYFTEDVPVLFFGGISSNWEIIFPTIRKFLRYPNIRLEYVEESPVDGALKRAKQLLQQKVGK